MSKDKKIITYSSLVICLILVFIYCLSPLHIGINNSGQNAMIENSVGLSGINDGQFYIKYNIIDASVDGDSRPFVNLIKPVVKLAGNFTSVFDIRILSFIYLILLLVSIFYLNKYIDLGNKVNNIIFAALLIFVYMDLSYLVYLNTLYAEAAFYVLFLLGISLYIKLVVSEKPQIPTTVFFFVISVIICGIIKNMFLLFIPFAAMGIYLALRRKDVIYRIIVAVFTLILIVYPVINYSDIQYENKDAFNSVFYGALYESTSPKSDIAKLKINEKYASLAGKNTYENLPEYVYEDEFKKEFYDKVSSGSLFSYYALNPQKFISQYKFVGYNAFETYPKYSGNFTLDSGKPADAKAGGFKLYNLIKEKVFPKTLWFVYLVPLLLIVLLAGYRKLINNTGIVVMGISVAASSMIAFVVPMINSGLVDISRTMAVYNVIFDALIIMLVSILIYITTKRKQEFKDKYGLSQ